MNLHEIEGSDHRVEFFELVSAADSEAMAHFTDKANKSNEVKQKEEEERRKGGNTNRRDKRRARH